MEKNGTSHSESCWKHSPTRQGFDLQNHDSVQFKVTIVQVLVFIETLKIALKNYISNYACGIDIGGEDVSPECKKAKDDFASADGTFEEMTFQGGFSL